MGTRWTSLWFEHEPVLEVRAPAGPPLTMLGRSRLMPCMVLDGVIALRQFSSLLPSRRGRVPRRVLQTWAAVWQAVFLDHEFVVILQIAELRKAVSV